VALSSWIIRSTVLRGQPSPFVMELPPYRVPTLKGLVIHMWERTWEYVKKAGTVILAISIILWALMTFPQLSATQVEKMRGSGITESRIAEAALANSLSGRIGGAMAIVTEPVMGFDWRTDVALVGGFAAKEVIVSTLGTAYSLGEVDARKSTALSERLAREPGWSPLMAMALMLFTMLYSPCFATLVVIRRETGSIKWAAFAVVMNTVLASAVAALVYQVGGLMGL
jgi:ferrous iron transport protein B